MFYNRIERCTDTDRENSDLVYFYSHTVSLTEFRSCVKVEVAVLGTPSLIDLNTISVDVKEH